MSKIDLSKAKIGDKFRTRDGSVMEYVGYDNFLDLYIVSSENNKPYLVQKDGRYLSERECFSDLIVQVLDKPLDELIEEGTKQFRESRDAIAEENELQRRHEVLKYADMLFFNQKDTRIALFGYDVAINTAECIVKSRYKYLKDGKLC